MKILTISIAAYNAEKTLGKCLDSITSTKCIDKLEVFIVNDGSNDGTLNIARQYSEMYPASVFVIDKENGGHGSTINATVVRTTAKYYKIVDADDWVESDNLEKLVEYLESSEVDLVINPFYSVDCKTNTKTEHIANKSLNYYEIYGIDSLLNNGSMLLFMHKLTFRADVVKQMGPIIDEHCFYVDLEYVAFSMQHVKTFTLLDFPVYDYLQGDVNQSVSIQNRIKRITEHRRVSERLVNFYKQHSAVDSDNLDVIGRYIALFPVRNMFLNIFLLPLHEGKKQFRSFFAIVPNELLNETGDKLRLLLRILITCNSFFYYPLIGFLKLTGKLE